MAPMSPPPPRLPVALLIVWLPLAVLLPLAASRATADPLEGFWLGLRSVAVGALLMTLVWQGAEWLGWPEEWRPATYVMHLGVAVAFAAAWRGLVLSPTLASPGGGAAFGRDFAAPLMLWDLMLKMTVYGLVVTLFHALRQTQRARVEHLRAVELDALSARAQLAALQAQINPHFLFNTLHSLSVLIRRVPGTAEAAVDRLAELLRFVLDHSGREDIALRDELRFVSNYLALEQLRFEERLRVATDVDAAALSARVPPFCLQPLVENALHHGLAPRESGGTVTVSARREDDTVVLQVADDGVGPPSRPCERPGVGLASLRRRIEHQAGGQLIIEHPDGGGFRATVRIPFEGAARDSAGARS